MKSKKKLAEMFDRYIVSHWHGRIGRLQFLKVCTVYYIIYVIAGLIIGLAEAPLKSGSYDKQMVMVVMVAIVIAYAVYFCFLFSFPMVKRLQDIDQSGWWCILILISFGPLAEPIDKYIIIPYFENTVIEGIVALLGVLALGALLFVPGTKKSNEYGSHPSNREWITEGRRRRGSHPSNREWI